MLTGGNNADGVDDICIYRDVEYQPADSSYVDAAVRAGYSILTFNRLGVGQSSEPDACDVLSRVSVQADAIKQLHAAGVGGGSAEDR
ncbi:hypothetical protein PG984_003364 [Apiospora sp. TS-2023a]